MKRILLLCLIGIASILCKSASAAPETIKAGSFIVNMGIVPQTVGNGLKPYGLIYELLKSYKVPVKWIINNSKSRDGIDFTHNFTSYRGGAFIIPAEFRTPTINAVIVRWQLQGVIGATSTSDLTLEVYKTIYYAPNWTMDKYNGHIAVGYFANAGIPASAYGGDSSNWKIPSQLGACDDIFVLPHADPTWTDHNNLYYWNQNHKGNIWAGCHAVSAMENLSSPDGAVRMNFLSTGLSPTSTHRRHSTPSFLYANPTDFVMQFMGSLDNATANGSERIFYPERGRQWRPSTKVSVYDVVDPLIPAISEGPAAAVVYGRAFGDINRGWVMYESGHSLTESGTTAEKVAAQRAFFNFSFSVAVDRLVHFEPQITGLPEVLIANTPYTLDFTVPPGIDLNYYTIEWSSSCGGTFSPNANTKTVTFTAPIASGSCIVSLSLTDGCGRQYFQSRGVFVNSVLSGNTITLQAARESNKVNRVQWTSSNNKLVNHYEVQRSFDAKNFSAIAIFFSTENSSETYIWKDAQVGNQKAYYRIKAVGGETSYSPVQVVDFEGTPNEKLQIINPVHKTISFTYNTENSEAATVNLIGMTGQQVLQQSINFKQGFNRFDLPLPAHAKAGTYVLEIKTNSTTMSKKLIISN